MASPRDLPRASKQQLMDASDCGGNAFYDGRPVTDNPWDCFNHAAEHHTWNRGWRTAKAEEPKWKAETEALYAAHNGKTLEQILSGK